MLSTAFCIRRDIKPSLLVLACGSVQLNELCEKYLIAFNIEPRKMGGRGIDAKWMDYVAE